DTVNKSKTECNVDMPESGLEALMQVMVCEKQIAWRDQSLRLIVLSTDAGFHYAGDGKLGGIVKPNDMQCHLDSDGLYTHYAFHDYPSISQIHHMAKERRANVIFAVTDKQKPLYSRLSEVIEGASYGIVEEDSSNIVPLLTEKVNDIISRVRLRHEPEQSVKIKYFSACKGNEKVETSTCDKLEPGDTVEFEIEVSVDKCSEDPIPPIHIYPEGRNESVTIELTMICKCKCEEPGDPGFIVNDDLCNKNGDNKCGICSCHKGYVGRHCECEVDSAYTDITSDNLCRMDNSSSVCSGRGMCVCGKCQCNKREPPQEIYGEFCQCTNYENCYDIASGRSCSGHGECKCSKCECNDGWTGPRCSCQDSQDKCIRPGTNKVCSRNGICECNQCQCNTTYTGKFCEDCPTCTNVCDELTPCVQCQTFKTGDLLAKECKKNCTAINIIMVKEIENSEKICSGHDDNDCRFLFTYAEIDGILEVKVQEVLECPTSINILTIVISVVALIVALGLASLIVWKVVTTIKDRREYAQFILHQDQAKWTEQDNPIFKQATTVTSNPMFGKND
ncbi:Integrin beta-1, partial [Halocaridina rubra]